MFGICGFEVVCFVDEVVAFPYGVEKLAVSFAHLVVADEVGELVLEWFRPNDIPYVLETHFLVAGQRLLGELW